MVDRRIFPYFHPTTSIFVDDKATRKYWRSHRRHFIDAVDQRRVNVEHFRMGSYEGSEASLSADVGPTRLVAPPLASPLPAQTPDAPAAVETQDTVASPVEGVVVPLTFALNSTDHEPVGSPS